MSEETRQFDLQQFLKLRSDPSKLIPALKAADEDTLYALMSMSSTGLTGAEYEAVRTVAAAIVQARFLRIEAAANSLTASSSRLERLTLLLIVLTGVLVVMTMALIVEPLIK